MCFETSAQLCSCLVIAIEAGLQSALRKLEVGLADLVNVANFNIRVQSGVGGGLAEDE